MKDYYKLLEIDPNATAADIKKAYRRLAHKYHPDRNPDDSSCEQKFKEIVEANETLSNAQKRQQYDHSLKGGGFTNLEDMFANMFGAGFNPFNTRKRRHRAKRQDPTPDNATINIELTLGDLEKGGASHTFEFTKNVACQACNGLGGKSTAECHPCQGIGIIIQDIRRGSMIFQTKSSCAECDGTGQYIVDPCTNCGAIGVIAENNLYRVTITTEKL